MEITIQKKYKSIDGNQIISLPDFCIITGKNGTGKSHFLELLANRQFSQIIENGKNIQNVKYIPFNGLNPNVDTQCDFNTVISHVQNIWNSIQQPLNNYKEQIRIGNNIDTNQKDQWVLNQIRDANQKKAIKSILEKSNESIENITQDLIKKHLNFSNIFPDEMFTSQFATIFKAYHTRIEDNRYLRFKNTEYGENNNVLTENEFLQTFGPAPWDLINEILSNSKLPYRVNNPTSESKESTFKLELFDPKTDLKITVNDLSTGEKVLMSLALAIYNSTEGGAKIDLLLLDEPDAALHPEFSKYLIDSLNNYIVKKAGVSVIITTHSPTTIAASEGIAIFEIQKENRIPLKINKNQAINLLTEGLANIRVTTEARRQVFVESYYDVGYYEKFHELVCQFLSSSTIPQFLPPHSRNGSNCTDVSNIVESLTELGNDLVYGIIDFDGCKVDKDKVLVLGSGSRYAIENYIFDPLFIGLLLIRENIVTPQEIGIVEIKNYVDCKKLSNERLQVISNYVSQSLGFDITDSNEFATLGGLKFMISNGISNIQGHLLEQKMLSLWPKLNNIKKNKTADNIVKDYVLDTVITDFPELINKDFKTLFEKIN